MKQKIFIISLPSYIDQTTIQRIMRDVPNIDNFIQHSYTLCCFAPFGDGITATFFVKDGADLGLYCLVKIDPSKITQDDKDKLSSFGTQDNTAGWKTAFVELVIAECRKLCEIIYPSRLFRLCKALDLCPCVLQASYERHPSLKDREDDPADPTPFFFDEIAYQALKESFYRNRQSIRRLLSIPEEETAIYIEEVDVDTDRLENEENEENYVPDSLNTNNTKWATVAQEERVALIIFFLFVRPGDELFLRSNARNNARNNECSECDGDACVSGTNASDAYASEGKATLEASLSNFSKALLAWL